MSIIPIPADWIVDKSSYFPKYLWDVDNLFVFSSSIATLGLLVKFFWYFKLFYSLDWRTYPQSK